MITLKCKISNSKTCACFNNSKIHEHTLMYVAHLITFHLYTVNVVGFIDRKNRNRRKMFIYFEEGVFTRRICTYR